MPRRTRFALLSALLVVPLLALAVAPPAQAVTSNATVKIELVTPAGHLLDIDDIGMEVQEDLDHSWQQVANLDTTGGVATASVPAGVVRVKTFPFATWTNVTSPSVTVKAGSTKLIKVVEPVGATISGTVIASGAPLAGADVLAYTTHGTFVAQSTTNGSGQYSMSQLPTGSYYIQFNSHISSVQPAGVSYTWGYFRTKSSTPTNLSSATKLAIKAQGKTSKAQLKTGISGHVDAYSTLTVKTAFSEVSAANDEIRFVGPHSTDGFTFQLDGSGSITTRVIPGKWRVAVAATFDHILHRWNYYWYRAGTGPTLDESQASWVTNSGKSPVTITLTDTTN